MTVEKLCFGQYERAMRADRACRSCKESVQCIPLQEELTMAGEPRAAHGWQYGTSPAPSQASRVAVRGRPLNSLVPRLRQLAALGVQIAAEAADAIEQQSGATEPMRNALAWYAEPGNWRRPTKGRKWSNSPACDDKGSRARMVMMEAGS
ncbi:hypothetical protein GPA27_13515 [Aromatoleum toluolicum]|uniref:Uncharacterized protein n=1 Tax=Aromatoleum toluolicum TaxID=90060 RepID=A0ABX1NGM2_9RHOO|nr:hypothetical protein [Aromatoleum toluolicum]NMF98404.1 hypothetical protein [Aromatoleum toluolicum]